MSDEKSEDKARPGHLTLGWHLDDDNEPLTVPAKEINHHTAILAQSGSGKSFFMGRLVEEILINTKCRVVVLDSNGDFRKGKALNDDAWEADGREKGWGEKAYDGAPPPLKKAEFEDKWRHVSPCRLARDERGAANSGQASMTVPLRLRWDRLGWRAIAAYLGLGEDPHTGLAVLSLFLWSRDEDAKDGGTMRPLGIDEVQAKLQAACDQGLHALDAKLPGSSLHLPPLMARVARVAAWEVWDDASDGYSLFGILSGANVQPSETSRFVVIDLPSLRDPDAQLAVVDQALAALWDSATEAWEKASASSAPDTRVPTILIVDEAHNFIPRETSDPLAERVAENLHRIAAEGRKYGLVLVLATQRPAKVREGILAECENVCLLRMQSPVDHKTATETWGIPPDTVARTAHFRRGDGLLHGRWVFSTTVFHAAWRRTQEGGANLRDEHWATPYESGEEPGADDES